MLGSSPMVLHAPVAGMFRHRGAWLVTAVLLATLPATAHAVDGIRPRSLVVWNDTPCMTIVDRSVDPVVHMPYAVSFEDTEHTDDEVETGRRHQMIGLCRQHTPQAPMPVWLSQADVDDAATVDLVDPADVLADEILDTMPQWADCAVRIVADADRRPITDAAGIEGVDWDTTSVAEGAWVVEGYTWDPAFNQWSPRGGVIAVFDDASAPDNLPAAAITTGEVIVKSNEAATIEGCVVATEGSTLRADWAIPAPGDEQVWQSFVEDVAIDGTTFAIDFLPPEEIIGGSANLRVEIIDAMGRSYTAYMVDQVTVIPGGGGCADSGGGFLEDPACDTSSGTNAGSSSGTAQTGDTTAAANDTGDGSTSNGIDGPSEPCNCRETQRSDAPTAALLLGVVAWMRRRRSR